jgi:hypothetical protein
LGWSIFPNHVSTTSDAFFAMEMGFWSVPSRVKLAACKELGLYPSSERPQPVAKQIATSMPDVASQPLTARFRGRWVLVAARIIKKQANKGLDER